MTGLVAYAERIDDFKKKVAALKSCSFPIWETERIADFVAWAVAQLSPLRLDDVAEIVETLEIEPDSGWYCHRHMLVAGKRGVVREVDWRDGTWVYAWEPEAQTWISSLDGVERPVNRASWFHLSEARLRRVIAEAAEREGAK